MEFSKRNAQKQDEGESLKMDKKWEANWIGFKECPARTAPIFKKNFILEKIPESSKIYITGLGAYVIKINGVRVGEDILQPAFSNYDKTVYYNEYEITEYLLIGDNIIEVILGNYWFNEQQKTAWEFESAPWKDTPRLLAEIYADQKMIVKTDKSWDCAKSCIVYNSLRCGEKYDATQIVRYFRKADVMLPPGGKLRKQKIAPIRVSEIYPVKCIAPSSDKRKIYDFGINLSGNVELTGRGKYGSKVTIIYFERILENGRPDTAHLNLGIYEDQGQTDEYIFNGEGVETWHSEFGYNGFRYIMVEGDYEEINFKARCFHTQLEEAGGMECDNKLITEINNAIRRSTLTNFFHMPTDCPHCEKLGWIMDAHVSSEQAYFNYDMTIPYEKMLQDFDDCQLESGKIPCILPSDSWGYHFMENGPVLDGALFLIPWQMYRFTGERKYLMRSYKNMKQYLGYLRFILEDGICNQGISDWLPVWHLEDRVPQGALVTMFSGHLVNLFRKIAIILGEIEDAKEAEELFQYMHSAFLKQYGALEINNQIFYAAQLAFGFTDREEETLHKLLKTVEDADYHITGGLLCSRYLLDVLTEYGRFDVAYKIASQKTFPGWGDLITRNSGTLGEDWWGGRSGNHHMFSAIGAWYYKALAGFNIDEKFPGFRHIYLIPHIPEDIKRFKAWHMTPYGKLSLSWDENIISIEIPEKTTATFRFGSIEKNLNAGTFQIPYTVMST